jgi:hypothetical protein
VSEQIDNQWSEMTKDIEQDAAVDISEGGADQALDVEPEVNAEPEMEIERG